LGAKEFGAKPFSQTPGVKENPEIINPQGHPLPRKPQNLGRGGLTQAGGRIGGP